VPDDLALLESNLRTRLEVLAEQCNNSAIAKHPSIGVDKIIQRARAALELGKLGEAEHYTTCASIVMTAIEHGPDQDLAEKVRDGHRNREDRRDKAEIRDLAKGHWRKHPGDTVAAVLKIPGIAPWTRHYNRRTVRGWIKDLKPGGTSPGRPKK
jgi:hypothetical protein